MRMSHAETLVNKKDTKILYFRGITYE